MDTENKDIFENTVYTCATFEDYLEQQKPDFIEIRRAVSLLSEVIYFRPRYKKKSWEGTSRQKALRRLRKLNQ